MVMVRWRDDETVRWWDGETVRPGWVGGRWRWQEGRIRRLHRIKEIITILVNRTCNMILTR